MAGRIRLATSVNLLRLQKIGKGTKICGTKKDAVERQAWREAEWKKGRPLGK